MLLRILRKDLKRKKTMNVILLLFIILAAMFVASGINNVITVMNGTDYYMDKAGIGDYILIIMGSDEGGAIEKILSSEPAVQGYRMDNVVFGAQGNFSAEGIEEIKTKNTVIIQAPADSALTFFDEQNNPITEIEKGHARVSGGFLEENHLESGDTVLLSHSGVEMTLVLDGRMKDAFLGSKMMGNTRILLNEEDMRKLQAEDNEELRQYQGRIAYIDTEDVRALASTVNRIDGIIFDGSRSTVKMCYIMDMIVAFIILILSICLIIVSFVVLKFSISFTIAEEFREIGVMKAIGIPNAGIRSLYLVKYLMLAIVGAAVGFFASIPFGDLLLKSVSENMVLGNDAGVWINLAGVLLVVAVIVLFAYLCTGKVNKLTPIDAIRSGQTGERYRKKAVCRIAKSRVGVSLYMAVNDVLSNPGRFFTIMISFTICTLFVLIMVNTTSTMNSSKLITTFGTKSDLYVTDVTEAMKNMKEPSRESMEKSLILQGEELTAEGMPAQICVEIQYKYKITFEGEDYLLTCQQGLGTKSTDYTYMEGTAPQNANEIAITPKISEITGAQIGDTVVIDFGEEKRKCMVTALFQTMNQLGEVVRLSEDAPTDFKYISSIMQTQIRFTDSPSEAEIELRKERIKELYGNDEVMNAAEYCADCIGVVDTMETVQYLLLGITLVVVFLVAILMERSFVADERSQIAILKAIGFKNGFIIRWHTLRFGVVGLVSVLAAALLSIPMTHLCITPIFGMMGAKKVEYNFEFVRIFVVYPGIVLAVTVLAAWLTALYTRTVKSSDTANIE